MILPVVLVGAFPPTAVLVTAAGVVLAVWVPARRTFKLTRAPLALSIAVRTIWLTVAVVGLVSLLGDVEALS